jgi:hypothetical protein
MTKTFEVNAQALSAAVIAAHKEGGSCPQLEGVQFVPVKKWEEIYQEGMRIALSSQLFHLLEKDSKILDGADAVDFEARGGDAWPAWPKSVSRDHGGKV